MFRNAREIAVRSNVFKEKAVWVIRRAPFFAATVNAKEGGAIFAEKRMFRDLLASRFEVEADEIFSTFKMAALSQCSLGAPFIWSGLSLNGPFPFAPIPPPLVILVSPLTWYTRPSLGIRSDTNHSGLGIQASSIRVANRFRV